MAAPEVPTNLFIVADSPGGIPVLDGGPVTAQLYLVQADPTETQTAEEVACQGVKERWGSGTNPLFSYAATPIVAVDVQAQPTVYTTTVQTLPIPGVGDGPAPDPA